MKLLLLALATATPLCAKALPAIVDDRTLSYGCSDIVVVGRLKNGDYTPVHDTNDIIGHGWIDAQIKVKRQLRGAKSPSSLPIKYFAHTYLRDDQDAMYVLSGNSADGFRIERAQLMKFRPIIAAACDP